MNPQADEIAKAKAAYTESPELQQRLPELSAAAEQPATIPTEAAGRDEREKALREEDLHKWLRSQIRFQQDNLYFEFGESQDAEQTRNCAKARTWNKNLTDEDGKKDMEEWIAFLMSLRPHFHGKTYAELEGTDLGGLLAKPLGAPMEYSLIRVERQGGTFADSIQIRLWIGYPYEPDSLLI